MNMEFFRRNCLTRLDIIIQGKLKLHGLLLLYIDIQVWDLNGARMSTSNPGAQHLIFLIGIDITMMVFGLMMELQSLKTLGNYSIILGSLILSTMLTDMILQMKTIHVAQIWVISWIGTPKSESIATQTFNPGYNAVSILFKLSGALEGSSRYDHVHTKTLKQNAINFLCGFRCTSL